MLENCCTCSRTLAQAVTCNFWDDAPLQRILTDSSGLDTSKIIWNTIVFAVINNVWDILVFFLFLISHILRSRNILQTSLVKIWQTHISSSMRIVTIQRCFLLCIAWESLSFWINFVCDKSSVFNQLLDEMIWFAFLLWNRSISSANAITERDASPVVILRKTRPTVLDDVDICIFRNHVSTMEERWCRSVWNYLL